MIKEGDVVIVSFHNSQFTLCKATVMHTPCATGDSWILQEENGRIHYVSEGCTITKESAIGTSEGGGDD